MELRYAHLVDHVTFDPLGKPILVGIFDVVRTTAATEIRMPHAFVFASFSASPLEGTEQTLEVRLTGPDGEDAVPRQTFVLRFQPTGARRAFVGQAVVNMSQITLQSEGEYTIRFYHGDTQIGETALRVETAPTPPVPPEALGGTES
ncbi:hypothetical protein tb265_20230 [Gemmatimonadetes bacterium T265]|nr:hypothetical protein tb265_20230 [Gemmatimonadetes bacterium T265]